MADESVAAPAAEYLPPFLAAEREIEYGLGWRVMEPEAVEDPEPIVMPPVEAPPDGAALAGSPVAPAAPPPGSSRPRVEAPRIERASDRDAPDRGAVRGTPVAKPRGHGALRGDRARQAS